MAVTLLAFDGLWLGVVAKHYYKRQIGHVMATRPDILAAVLFYIVYLIGILILIIIPAHSNNSFTQLLWSAPLFGFVSYATYDLTSKAVIKKWPWKVTIVDLLWGTFVTTVTAIVGYWVMSVLFV